jgi:hypothetical protein
VAGVLLSAFEKVMFFEMGQEFLEIDFHHLSGYGELTTDFVRDLCFGAALLQKFEHSRADPVQSEHLTLTDIEDDSSVPVVRGTDAFGNSHDFESFPQFAACSDVSNIAILRLR